MKLLDLFAGLCGWSAAFRLDPRWEVVTLDYDPQFKTDIIADILEPSTLDMLVDAGPFDLVLASPPCEGFTVMNIGKNWHGPGCVSECRATHINHSPKTRSAGLALDIVLATRTAIRVLRPKHYIIENPRGKLRALAVMADLERRTVTYCQLGEQRMKPTDLWGGFPAGLRLPPPCRNGDPCHVSAPRGSRTPGSTQGIKTAPERAEIPFLLSQLVYEAGSMSEPDRSMHGNAPATVRIAPQLELW